MDFRQKLQKLLSEKKITEDFFHLVEKANSFEEAEEICEREYGSEALDQLYKVENELKD